MKDAVEAAATSRALEPESFANRKLIRPTLARTDHGHAPVPVREREQPQRPERGERPARNDHPRNDPPRNDHGGGRRQSPPEQTNAENFYYQKQIQAKTPMVIMLRSGEELHGVIQWYDKCCLKLTRQDASSVMIYKPAIKYMFKEGENSK